MLLSAVQRSTVVLTELDINSDQLNSTCNAVQQQQFYSYWTIH